MNYLKCTHAFLLLFATVLLTIGCSNAKSPIEPSHDAISGISDNLPVVSSADSPDRTILAAYDAVIDPFNKTFIVTPIERNAQYHFPLTQLLPNVLQITGFGFTPNFWADIKLRHPYPGSGIDAFDPRVIAILPANPGVRFIYPVIGVGGNNAVVLEPDGYTKLFDELGGSMPGNVNPFRAYFKDQQHRIWSGTGVTEETQRWQMNLDGFGGTLRYKIIVDVSTNYPDSPTPVTDNAPEPVQIDTYIEQELTTDGGGSLVEVTLLDWQGESNIECRIESPQLFSDTVQMAYSRPGSNPNEYIFSGTISNSLLSPAGNYNMLISAKDIPTGICVFSETSVTVIEPPPTDGNLIWAKRAGGTSYDFGYANATLSDDSIIAAGGFRSTAWFGRGEPNEKYLMSEGIIDIFIARYNTDGTLIWATQAGGWGNEYIYSMTVLSDDSIAVSGSFEEIATFGKNEPNQTILTSDGNDDIFVARYNQDGTLAWAKRAGGENFNEDGFGITSLPDDSLFVTGEFFHIGTFGPGETNQTILTSNGIEDIFIARYNPNGTLEWAKRVGDMSSDTGMAITALSDNTLVVTGRFEGYVVFGEGEPNQKYLNASSGSDVFVARYNPDGTLVWAKNAGGSGLEGVSGIGITSLSDDSTVVTGYFYESSTFGKNEPNQTILTSSGGSEIFVARYNPNGTLAWAKRAGGSSDDYAIGITAWSEDSFALTGWFKDTSVFGPGENNETALVSRGLQDILIARFNSDGTLAWAKSAGGTKDDFGYGISLLSDESLIVTGTFYYPCTFGSGEPNETVLTSAGWNDIFIARFEK